MRPHLLAPVVALALLPLATACGSGSATAPPGPPADASATAASAPASKGGGAAANCAEAAPAKVVGSAVKTTVGEPTESRADGTLMCSYAGPKTGHLIIRIQSDQTAEGFATARRGFDDSGTPTTTLTGFEEEAYTGVTGSGSYRVTTVVARRGPLEILVTGNVGVPEEKALIRQLMDRQNG
jgi:hypothetical protein